MCNCGGGGYTPPTVAAQPQTQQANFNPNCSYTLDQLFFWKYKLECVRNGNYYNLINLPASTITSQLGIIVSAINFFSTSPCWYQPQLDTIAQTVALILNNTSC
jgi:hypothetical protein